MDGHNHPPHIDRRCRWLSLLHTLQHCLKPGCWFCALWWLLVTTNCQDKNTMCAAGATHTHKLLIDVLGQVLATQDSCSCASCMAYYAADNNTHHICLRCQPAQPGVNLHVSIGADPTQASITRRSMGIVHPGSRCAQQLQLGCWMRKCLSCDTLHAVCAAA